MVLGIKPQMLKRVGAELAPVLRDGQLVISVIAGATTGALANVLRHQALVRAMPNTPAQLGQGMTVWYATPAVSEPQRAHAAALAVYLGPRAASTVATRFGVLGVIATDLPDAIATELAKLAG